MELPMRSTSRLLIFVSTIFLLSVLLFAQNASVSGEVVDPQRAAINGSTVTLTRISTQVKVETKTNERGSFVLPPVVPGTYEIKAEAQGFTPVVLTGITLEIGESKNLTLELKVSGVQQTVEVTSELPELNTNTADRGLMIEPAFVQSIPLNIRNPLQLIDFAAGVTKGDDGLSGQDATSESRTNTFRINGAKGSTTDVLIDGAANTTAYYNQDAGIPGVESVQEFRVYTGAYAPEFGRTSGGLESYALHTGTDQFRGSVFEFYRNEEMDANGFNANHTNPITPRGTFSRNQYGATLGGPVLIPRLYNGKKKTFFFVSYEGLRDTSAGSFLGTVPTALERTGDFSQTYDAKGNLIVLYNPYTTTTGKNYSRTPVPGNNINNIAAPNPIGSALVNLYPLPNRTGTGGSDLNNFFSNAPNTDNNNSFDIRIDHQFNEHHSIFGHITDFTNHINYSDYYGNGLSPEDANDRIPGKNITVDHTWIIRPNMTFEHHFSWAHSESNRNESVLKSPASLGFDSSIAPGVTANQTPQLSISGPPAVGGYSELGNFYPFERNYSSVYQYAGAMTWVKGKHTLKYGIDLRSYPTQLWDPEQMSISSGGSSPDANFTDGFSSGTTVLNDSGNGVADLLLGLGTVSSGYEPETRSVHGYGAVFAQDEYRITPRFVVTYGLRYNYETGDVEENNLLNYIDLTSVSPLQAQVSSLTLTGGVGIPRLNGISRQLQNPRKLDFDPRLGIAYNLNDKTVLHAGAGIFHHPAAAWQQFPSAAGAIRTTTSVDAQANGVTPLAGYQLSSPFPTGLPTPQGNAAGLSIDLGDSLESPLRRQDIAYQQSWSFDIQRELPASFVVTAAYAGNEGVHLMVNEQLNQLPDSDLALGSGLLTLESNPLYGLIDSASSINTPTVKNSQLLRPHPQFQNMEGNNIGVGHSTYHAGQLTVEHRMKYGLAETFAYTFSKAIDNVGEMTSVAGTMGAVTDTYCLKCDRSLSDQNERTVIRWSTRYELPFGAGKPWLNQGFVKHILGGWAVSTIYQYDSGRPIAVSYTNVSDLDSSSTLSRPNSVPGVSAKVPGGPKILMDGTGVYFNKAAFSATPTYSFGTAPRYLPDVNAPKAWDLDSMIEKNTRFSERYSLVFRAEAFNTLNNVTFGGPTTSFTSSTFGQEATLSQTNTPRNVQLSLRFSF
jgi:Carboxypeptidase regulatory-like domain